MNSLADSMGPVRPNAPGRRPGQTAYPSSIDSDSSSDVAKTPFDIGDWQELVHPNGTMYYYHPQRRITTNENLRSIAKSNPLTYLDENALQLGPQWVLPEDWEVLVKTKPSSNGTKTHFQWIDHTNCMASENDQNFFEFQRKASGDFWYTSRYWAFVHMYPNHVRIDRAVHGKEAFEALTWCYADRLLFGQSNATFSQRDSKELLDILESLRNSDGVMETWFIGCILEAIYSDRHNTHHGKPDAYAYRLRERQETTTMWETQPLPIAILYYTFGSLLCFGIPHSYFKRIQGVDRTRFRDGVSTDRWQGFISSLLGEWRDSNLVATVLLSANISFLALPEIDHVTQILALISIMTSLGSVAFGSYLSWRHQAKQKTTGEMGLRYFTRAKILLESSIPLAFVLALPIVCLLWALLCFMAAVCEYALRNSPETSDVTSTIGISVVITLPFLGASALLAWLLLVNVWSPLTHKHAKAAREREVSVENAHAAALFAPLTSSIAAMTRFSLSRSDTIASNPGPPSIMAQVSQSVTRLWRRAPLSHARHPNNHGPVSGSGHASPHMQFDGRSAFSGHRLNSGGSLPSGSTALEIDLEGRDVPLSPLQLQHVPHTGSLPERYTHTAVALGPSPQAIQPRRSALSASQSGVETDSLTGANIPARSSESRPPSRRVTFEDDAQQLAASPVENESIHTNTPWRENASRQPSTSTIPEDRAVEG